MEKKEEGKTKALMENNCDKVVFLGNGINLLSKNYSWKDLMKDLIKFVGGGNVIKVGTKPFPLLYEELLLYGKANKAITEQSLKEKVKELLSKLRYNKYHGKIFDLGVSDIITTNYDYNLEKSQVFDVKKGIKHFETDESKYSLLRHKEFYIDNSTFRIWHIHGEEDKLDSILLGNEQYSGYLQRIRNYFFDGVSYEHEEFTSLKSRLTNGVNSLLKNKVSNLNDLWVDHFFKKDVYILGFEFYFTEIHLWWILNYWARLKNGLVRKKIEKSAITNDIYYIYKEYTVPRNKKGQSELERCKKELEMYKSGIMDQKSKLGLFKSYGIILKPIKANSWEKFYDKALRFIEEN